MTVLRQPPIPTELAKAARSVVDAVDGEGNAPAAWVHAGAVAQHAAQTGLAPAGLGMRATLELVASHHETLEHWGKIAADLPAAAERQIEALWAAHTLIDPDDHPALWYGYPLGDLYQGLSTEAVKGRAFCQTPWWIGELLLHISYDRAVEEWRNPQVIDPSCGAGHLLVESFMRASSSREIEPRLYHYPTTFEALDAVHGVDLDPHAAATAAYRLVTLAYAQNWTGKVGNRRRVSDGLADAPIHVVTADSLLSDDEPLLERGQYHVVVANPPYITCKDADQTAAIKARYPEVAHRKFSLALPFHQLMMELLVDGGWCAQLTANSFMKREFGKKYVENWLPRFDMEWLIDTSGAYIPGHGTPTVIMSHRNRPPQSDTVHSILGKQGEPSAPEEPSEGLVWSAIHEAVYARESVERNGRRYHAAVCEHLDRRDAKATAGIKVDDEYVPDGWADPRDAAEVVQINDPDIEYTQPTLFDLMEAA